MDNFIDRAMLAFCSFAIGGILIKFLYAMWLCSLFISQIAGITQDAVFSGWIL